MVRESSRNAGTSEMRTKFRPTGGATRLIEDVPQELRGRRRIFTCRDPKVEVYDWTREVSRNIGKFITRKKGSAQYTQTLRS